MNHKELIEYTRNYYQLSCLPELSEADSLRLEIILEESCRNIFLEKILYAIDSFLEENEGTVAEVELNKQKKTISKFLSLDNYYSPTESPEYSDIQYDQWVKRYYYLSKLDHLAEQDESELEVILEMAESNPIVAVLIDFLDEIISETEDYDEELRLHNEASRYWISIGISLHFGIGNEEYLASLENSFNVNEENSHLWNSGCKNLFGQSYKQAEDFRSQRKDVDVMEVIVAKRVQHYLARFSGGLLKHLSAREIELYALHSLPAVYASSREEWQYQYSKTKEQFLDVIDGVVRKSVNKITSSLKRDPNGLRLYRIDSLDLMHFQMSSEILEISNLSWSEVGDVVAQKLGLETPNGKRHEDPVTDSGHIFVRPKNFKDVDPELTAIQRVDRSLVPIIQQGQLSIVYSPAEAALTPELQRTGPDRLPRIVCVDDSATVRHAVEHILHGQGYEATSIGNPLKALGLLFQLQPNLILCDITMPELDGYELCAMLRHSSAFRQTPIVMLTGKDGLSDRAKARMVGATDYLTKPFSPNELLVLIEKYVGPGDLNRSCIETRLVEATEEEFNMS